MSAAVKRSTLSDPKVLILSGGQGTRLYPLTAHRAKFSTPFGGQGTLLDQMIANCALSGFDDLHLTGNARGTADAVRQQIPLITGSDTTLVLSSDHLYTLDYRRMVDVFNRRSDKNVVIACTPVALDEARRMGVFVIDGHGEIVQFEEKPATPTPYKGKNTALASMGIYLFRTSFLIDLLSSYSGDDFGHHFIPLCVDMNTAAPYIHTGSWRDVGTIQAYYEENMRLSTRLIGPEVTLAPTATIEHSYLLGRTHVGSHSIIRSSIIDVDVHIGENVQVINRENHYTYNSDLLSVRSGITIVHAKTSLPNGFIF